VNCLVTAGPTYEPLDQVRRLTNFSTGRLGIGLAECLTSHGHQVTLLVGEQATWCGPRRAAEVVSFSTTSDLEAKLRGHAGFAIEAVFHAAAVSDFRFTRTFQQARGGALEEIHAGKLSTRTGHLLVELAPTPKLLPRLRDWFPAARLTGWKFEVDGDRTAALARAGEQLAHARTDACVVNGPAYGTGFGLLTRAGCRELADREALFAALLADLAGGQPA
jgi:phosphopantothenoylcysteine synthetase/decarboxylase